jgi:hypothetical protein
LAGRRSADCTKEGAVVGRFANLQAALALLNQAVEDVTDASHFLLEENDSGGQVAGHWSQMLGGLADTLRNMADQLESEES